MFTAISERIARSAAILAVAAVGLVPAAARADNLADALAGAYKTSGLLQQNRALLRAADEDVGIAVSALRPILDWTGRFSRSNSEFSSGGIPGGVSNSDGFFGLSAQLLLFDNGNSRLGIKAAQETVLATRQTLLSIEQSILLRAVQAYMNVIRTTEIVRLRENNVRVLGEELRAAQDRFEVGEVTRTDVALAESRAASSRTGLARARGDLVNAQEEYVSAVGERPHSLLPTPPLPKTPVSIDAAKAMAVRNHPDLLSVRHQVAASDLNVRRAEAAMGPTARLTGEVGFNNTYNSTNYRDNASIALSLSQRLYQGGALSAALRRSMAVSDSVRASLLTVQENVAQNAATAYVGLKVAVASMRSTQKQVEAAQVAFDGTREEAKLGARTTLDVLIAEQELLDAQAQRIGAQTDRYIAAYALLATQGLLTAERLKLDVQIYDAAAYYNRVKNAPSRYSRQGSDLDRVLRAIGRN
jgi:outer membrane protein